MFKLINNTYICKMRLFFIHFGLLFFVLVLFDNKKSIKEIHKEHLRNSPYKETKNLSKTQRKKLNLPPNAFYERLWELTMNPQLGRPTPEFKNEILKSIAERRKNNIFAPVAPGQPTNSWTAIGPNNIGGRTRVVLFDPNDNNNSDPADDYDRVFAGGVSGGLWINDDIDAVPTIAWREITSVPGNLAASCITVDPYNSQIMYLGTGETYTRGNVYGNGIYKSTDGGNTWTSVYSISSVSITPMPSNNVDGSFFVNDIIVWDPDSDPSTDNNSVLASFAATSDRNANGVYNFIDTNSYGLYLSNNGGNSWNRIDIYNTEKPTPSLEQFDDIEINTAFSGEEIWVSTSRNIYGKRGGKIYKGITSGNTMSFSLEHTLMVSGPVIYERTEIETTNDPNKFYILAEINNEADIFVTTDKFATVTKLNEPNDVDMSVPANDFARGQAFYNLAIESDPNNNNIVYVGGIDWFRSVDSGNNWDQISRWGLTGTANYAYVHTDQHSLVFKPNNSDIAVVGTDGGVFYASSLSGASSSISTIAINSFRETTKNYITTQFYRVIQSPIGAARDLIFGGTQDRGTPLMNNLNPAGLDSATQISGGDGAYCYIDQVGNSYAIANYVYNQSVQRFLIPPNGSINAFNNNEIIGNFPNEGNFINPGALDSNLDILYTNATPRSSTSYRIRRFKNLTGPFGSTTNDIMQTNALLNNSPTAFIVSPYTTSSTTLLIGLENGRLLRVENANTSSPVYTRIDDTDASEFIGSISDIELGLSESEIYVTFYNYGVNNIYYTQDGGANWESKDGNLPNMPIWSILANPFDTNEVILGTDLGVWKTNNFNDTSPTWIQSNNGMTDVPATDIIFRGTDSANRIVVATYGRGLFTGQFLRDGVTPTLSGNSITGNIIGPSGFANRANEIVEVYENSEFILSYTSNVPINWSIVSGIDKDFFTIDSRGNLSFRTPLSFEDPRDANTDNNYEIVIRATSATNNSRYFEQNLTVRVLDLILNDNSYSLEVFGVSCPGANNGFIRIDVFNNIPDLSIQIDCKDGSTCDGYSYIGLISDDFQSDNLVNGDYRACLNVPLGQQELCFDFTITEPENISNNVSASFDKENKTLRFNGLKKNTTYYIRNNETEYEITDPSFILPLNIGKNNIYLSTSPNCNKGYNNSFFVSEEVTAFPNPVTNILNVLIEGNENNIDLNIYNFEGKSVFTKKHFIIPQNRIIQIDMGIYTVGNYIISLKNNSVYKNLNIIKQ